MEKRWVLKTSPDQTVVAELAAAINISESLASMLVQRGISNFDEAKSFFRPNLNELHDPFLMQDMENAVIRLSKAISTGEKILIYGDYDVDGTTAVSLVYGFLSRIYSNLDFYIPDRYTEGYGVSVKGVEWAAANGFKLIISLDCGIKSIKEVALAKSLGVDFIICDHHKPGDELPCAAAVLDPKRSDCLYPYKELSGCGVGYKLLQAFVHKENIKSPQLTDYLDFTAVSIASDIVPTLGENRILLYHGLQLLNKNPRPGMKALIEVSGFKKHLDVGNLVFGLGPRINAAGRIAHAKAAVELMLSKTDAEAQEFAKLIDERNKQRKDFDASITSEALKMIEEDQTLLTAKSTVLFKDNWHKGVIGIVASRCIEKFYRPTIILTENKGYATGSARSVLGFDVYEAISKCAEYLEQFGGHTYAAGLTLQLDKVEDFRRKFEEVVSESIEESMLVPQIEIDEVLTFDQINQKFYNILKQMAPFGPGNMEPVFVSEFVIDDGSARLLKGEHIKVQVIQEDCETVMEAIGFNMRHFYDKIVSGQPFNLCYQTCENEFNGRKTLQLLIKDIKFVDC